MVTIDNSKEARLTRLQAKWQWGGAVATNLKSQVPSNTWVPSTWEGSISAPLTYVNNPDGTPVNAGSSAPTNVVNPVPPPTPPTNTPSQSEVSATNTVVAENNVASTAIAEWASQAATNTELNTLDVTQKDTKIKDANVNQSEFEKIQNQQILDKTKNEMEYQAQQQEDTNNELAATRLLQQSENEKNAALAAEMKVKQDNAEKELQIQNDVSAQTSAIAFAKLGLSFSWAAINTSQQIFVQGVRGLSELKSSNAKNYADTMHKINSTAFDHQMAINKIISTSHDNEFKSKERLREFIGATQNNILVSKKEAQANIQKAIDDYKIQRQTREDKLYADMNNANARLLTATKEIQTQVQSQEKVAKEKIDMLVKNWQWATLSPEQKVDYEQKAWVPANTTSNNIKVSIKQGINERMKAVVWKTVAIPSVTLNKMHTEIQKYMGLGYPQATAIQLVTDKYKWTLPDVMAMAAATKEKAKLDASKVALNDASAEAKKKAADAAMLKAQKAKTWWSGGWGWAASGKWQKATFTVNGENIQWTYDPVTKRYYDSDWKQVSWATPYVKPSTTSEFLKGLVPTLPNGQSLFKNTQ